MSVYIYVCLKLPKIFALKYDMIRKIDSGVEERKSTDVECKKCKQREQNLLIYYQLIQNCNSQYIFPLRYKIIKTKILKNNNKK